VTGALPLLREHTSTAGRPHHLPVSGRTNDPSNLQTLCSICNRDKDIQEMHFRKTGTLLSQRRQCGFPPDFTRRVSTISGTTSSARFNMFYQCAAVDEIEMKKKGIKRREWRIRLRSNNPGEWLKEHLVELFQRVRDAQTSDRSGPVRSIVLEAPDISDGSIGVFRVDADESGTAKTTPRQRSGPGCRTTQDGASWARMESQDWDVDDKIACGGPRRLTALSRT